VLSEIHCCHEHLPIPIWAPVRVGIAVGAVYSEVDSPAPHAIVAIDNVEAFFAHVYQVRRSLACAMEEFKTFNLPIILFCHLLNLCLEYLPKTPVLDALN
jgi:hypothetical protein